MYQRYLKNNRLTLGILILILATLPIAVFYVQQQQHILQFASQNPFKYASIDTMKESRDSSCTGCQLTDAEIMDDVKLSATLNNNYITVDTFWDYPSYVQRWVNAIRATGKHVWFRGHPNQWENNNGATGIMTPTQYLAAEKNFILNNPTLFQSGDIFDSCAEPENGSYWQSTYGTNWSWQPAAPNAATNDFNAFFVNSTNTADAAFQQIGVSGVITTVRSTNEWWATNPSLYASSVNRMGIVTIDTYPDATTTDPAIAANSWTSQLNAVEQYRNVPIVIGEMGYNNNTQVSDTVQQQVISAELSAIKNLPFVIGMNYWVGAGGSGYGGYTNIFSGGKGNWSARPAAATIADFFASKLLLPTSIPTSLPTVTPAGTQLGTLNISSYCQSLNQGTASLVNNQWECQSTGSVVNMTSACQWEYTLPNAYAVQLTAGNPYTWACYETIPTVTPTLLPTATLTPRPTITPTRVPTPTSLPTPTPVGVQQIGGLDLYSYCQSLHQGGSSLVNNQWVCQSTGTIINMTNACQWQYKSSSAYGVQLTAGNPYSWVCYGSVPTVPPTLIPTRIPTITPTRIPTLTPTVHPLTTPLTMTIGLDDIGKAGDNSNRSTSGNLSPVHTQQSVVVSVYTNSNQFINSVSGVINYVSSIGLYTGKVSLPNTINSGSYIITVDVPYHLKAQVPGIFTLVAGQSLTLPRVNLTAGDINNDNQLNILDYNILIGCMKGRSCSQQSRTASDVNDDGNVNTIDYNILLREMSAVNGHRI